ncbi:hypothetical protein ACU4GD_02860 [Cupriavidus basilensis]
MLGLRGLVVKSHGSADATLFEWAIKRGYDAARNGVIERTIQAFANKSGNSTPATGTRQRQDSSRTRTPPEVLM